MVGRSEPSEGKTAGDGWEQELSPSKWEGKLSVILWESGKRGVYTHSPRFTPSSAKC